MKLVSDFDGVLTELSHEAARVREIFLTELGGLSSLDAIETEMNEAPATAGWEVLGRISAFSDEDTFIHTNALAARLDLKASTDAPTAQALKDIRSKGYADFKKLAEVAYDRMVSEVMAGATSPIDPLTGPVLEGLLAKGVHITVISNSGSARIQDIFEKSAIPSTTYPLKAPGKLCVRGGARKFELSEEPLALTFNQRQVDIARPVYRSMIREEQPDAVIGDVFSLDLALPYALAQAEPALFPNGLKVILRVRPYTPRWALEFCRSHAKDGPITLHLLENLADLPVILGMVLDPGQA